MRYNFDARCEQGRGFVCLKSPGHDGVCVPDPNRQSLAGAPQKAGPGFNLDGAVPVRCPTHADDGDLIGCGYEFEAALDQGWADCPECGLAFKPDDLPRNDQ